MFDEEFDPEFDEEFGPIIDPVLDPEASAESASRRRRSDATGPLANAPAAFIPDVVPLTEQPLMEQPLTEQPLPVEPAAVQPLSAPVRPAPIVMPSSRPVSDFSHPAPSGPAFAAPAPVSAAIPTAPPASPPAPTAPPRDPNAVTLRIPASPTPAFIPPSPSFASPSAPGVVPPPPSGPPTIGAPRTSIFAQPAAAPTAQLPAMPQTPPASFAPAATVPPASLTTPRKRSVGKWLLAGVAGLALVVGGYFVGSTLNDGGATSTDLATVAADDAVTDVAVAATAAPTQVPAVSSAPLVSDAVEPVVAVAEAVSPSVVRITAGSGLGSGIVYAADGHIVTNAHVVGTSIDVDVTFSSGFTIPGIVIGTDVETDVAVVKVDPTDVDLVVAEFANPEDVKVGQLAVAIGSPFGLSQTVTAGIVSSARRPVQAAQTPGQNSTVPMIQTDAPINPGNSGGALVDREGRIIGMNTLIRTDPTAEVIGNIGVGFAIVSDIIQKVADGIIAGEPVQPSVLGVSGTDQAVGEEPGAVIGLVDPSTAAAAAGLLPGDRVVMFDGVEIQSMGDLAAVVRLSDADVPLSVAIVRDGELLDVFVELQTR